MSRPAQVWVSQLPLETGLNLAAFRVLDKLADAHHTDTNSAFRHVERLANELRCSKRTVQRALKDLELLGFVRRGNQKLLGHIDVRYRPTVYELALDMWLPQDAQPELEGVTTVVTPDPPVDNSSRGDRFGDSGVTTAVAVGTKDRTPRTRPSATTDRAHAHRFVDVPDELGMSVGQFCEDHDCGIRIDGRKRIDWTERAIRPVRRTA